MQCVMCKEEIAENSTVCPHCQAPVTKTEAGASSADLGMIIDGLDVSARKKELFHLIHKHDLLQKGGFIDVSKAKKAGISFKDRFGMATSILAFIFSFLYYFVTGMWRKGLAILGLVAVITTVLVVFEMDSYFLSVLPNLLCMMMAFGDQYRTKVLKETFWV